MTQKEIDKREKELNTKYYGDKSYIYDNLLMPITREDRQEFRELSLRRMTISIYAYEGICALSLDNKYIKEYLEPLYGGPGLTKKRIQKILDEQIETFSKATITYGVYTDSEDCLYNAITFTDE